MTQVMIPYRFFESYYLTRIEILALALLHLPPYVFISFQEGFSLQALF